MGRAAVAFRSAPALTMRAYRSPQKNLALALPGGGLFASGGHALHLARPQPAVSARRHRLGRCGSSRYNSRSWSCCITYWEVVFAIRAVKDVGLAHASAQQGCNDKSNPTVEIRIAPSNAGRTYAAKGFWGQPGWDLGREIDRANAAFGRAPLPRSLRDSPRTRPWTYDNEGAWVWFPRSNPGVAAHSDASDDPCQVTRPLPRQRECD
jgi:hypothetical protein